MYVQQCICTPPRLEAWKRLEVWPHPHASREWKCKSGKRLNLNASIWTAIIGWKAFKYLFILFNLLL